MRFAAGRITTHSGGAGLHGRPPRRATVTYDHGPGRIWTTGHEPGEIRTLSGGPCDVLVIGCCLTTDEEPAIAARPL